MHTFFALHVTTSSHLLVVEDFVSFYHAMTVLFRSAVNEWTVRVGTFLSLLPTY